jgi:hypothetical protein
LLELMALELMAPSWSDRVRAAAQTPVLLAWHGV